MSIHILLVDNDPHVLDTLSTHFMGTEDLKVVGTATTRLMALKWLEIHECDLVLSDVSTPNIDGIGLLQDIDQEQNRPLLVAMTAFDSDEIMVKCLTLGAIGYLPKSEAPEMIIHSLRGAAHGGTILSSICLSRLLRTHPPIINLKSTSFLDPI